MTSEKTAKKYAAGSALTTFCVLSGVGLAAAFWAAAVIETPTTIRAAGEVAPAGANRRAMHQEGGTVTELLVKRGDRVIAGQVLARVSPVQAEAQRGEQSARLAALRARAARLTAEVDGQDEIGFDVDVPAQTRRVEQALFVDRRAQQSAQIAALDGERAQYSASISAQEAQIEGLRAQSAILREIVGMHDAAAAKGAGPAAGPRLEAREREAAVAGQIAAIPGQIEAARAAVRRIEAKIIEAKSAARAEAQGLLSQTMAEASALESAVRTAEDRLSRTDVRSPVDGEIQNLTIASIGEVVAPGQAVAEVVPLSDATVIEARVEARQARSLAVGAAAQVRLDAYDVSKFGVVPGVVRAVSPSVDRDQKGGAYYKIRIETDSNEIGGEPLRLGASATVDILTGSRTLLAYFTDFAVRFGADALHER